MTFPLIELCLLIVLLAIFFQWQFIRSLKKRMSALQKSLVEKGELGHAIHAAAIPAEKLAAGRPRIVIELDNPLDVAQQEKSIGGVAGALAPAFVKKQVYQEMRKELSDELKGRGIVARVHLRMEGE